MRTIEELRHGRTRRTEIGLILARAVPDVERAVIAAHRSDYHRPILHALRLLR